MAKKYSFKKKERILKRIQFTSVMKHGSVYYANSFKLFYHKSEAPFSRIGIITPRIIKRAVDRNRLKRLAREMFRLNKHKLINTYDMVIILKFIPNLSLNTISSDFDNFIEYINQI